MTRTSEEHRQLYRKLTKPREEQVLPQDLSERILTYLERGAMKEWCVDDDAEYSLELPWGDYASLIEFPRREFIVVTVDSEGHTFVVDPSDSQFENRVYDLYRRVDDHFEESASGYEPLQLRDPSEVRTELETRLLTL